MPGALRLSHVAARASLPARIVTMHAQKAA
jgi:hypothetical protein